MTSTFQITEKDYINCSLLNGEMSHKSKMRHLAFDSLLIISGLFAWYFGKSIWAAGFIGAAIGGSLLPMLLRRVVAPPLLRRHYKKYRKIHKPLSAEVSDLGITFSSNDAAGTLKWEDIYGWRENTEYLLVYVAPKLYHIIPKRISNDGFDLEKLRNLLERHIGNLYY